jgi:hypothetical protein
MISNRWKSIVTASRVCIMAAAIAAPASAVVRASNVQAGCHCFRDRSFDPSRPESADLYVLATARNSLLAAASETSKAKVVKMRMRGTSETDLWLSLYRKSAWGRQDEASTTFADAQKTNDRDTMAEILADSVLARIFRVEGKILSELRSAGAETSEATLSLLVSSRTRPSPMEVFRGVRSGKTTWGKTLSSIGIALDTTGDLIEAQVRKARGEK